MTDSMRILTKKEKEQKAKDFFDKIVKHFQQKKAAIQITTYLKSTIYKKIDSFRCVGQEIQTKRGKSWETFFINGGTSCHVRFGILK